MTTVASPHPEVKESPLEPRLRNRWAERLTLVLLLAFAIFVFAMQGFWVSGPCMEPHLVTGDRLLSDRLAYQIGVPHRGDIIIFEYPKDLDQIYVKRVVGLPGETVSISGGDVYVNGCRLMEPYRIRAAHGDMPTRRVPAGQYFVMGDNRDRSDDSRFWGTLPRGDILGRAVACYWPMQSWQRL